MTQFNSLVPLGKLTVATAGTTIPLSTNCGPYGGGVNVPGSAWRGVVIQADPGNANNIFLLPRGKTASANPESILLKIGPGGSQAFPQSTMSGVGILPENFVLDMDGTGNTVVYGYGTLG